MVLSKHLQYAEYITNFLDTKFSVFGIKLGVDPFLNVIPVLGPFIGAAMSVYLLWIAAHMKVSRWVFLLMIGNILVDYIVGNIPVVGFFGDLVFKANVRNLRLLKKQLPDDILVGEVL